MDVLDQAQGRLTDKDVPSQMSAVQLGVGTQARKGDGGAWGQSSGAAGTQGESRAGLLVSEALLGTFSSSAN